MRPPRFINLRGSASHLNTFLAQAATFILGASRASPAFGFLEGELAGRAYSGTSRATLFET
jgi:hypothetical protein